MTVSTTLPGVSFSLRRILEILLALSLATGLGLILVLFGGLNLKYQCAAVFGGVGLGVLVFFPERRLLCLLLWVLVQPFSIEKVFYLNAIDPIFVPQAIVINAADVILIVLTGFMLLEGVFNSNRVWHWPIFASLFGLYCLWALVSSLMHGVYLDTGYTSSTPLALLHYFRTLLFIILIHSAIRTRAELICVLVALACIVFGEALLVGLSYVTGELVNFTRLTGGEPQLGLQAYSSSAGKVMRGVGTLGHTNEQALFHTLYTLPLISLLVVRNAWIRTAAMVVVAVSTVAIVLSFSRSAWMSYTLAIMVMGLVVWRRREIAKIALLIGAVVAVLMTVVLGILAEPIYERIAHGDDGATASRLRMISLATDLFLSHPMIGVGPGEFSEASLLQYPVDFKENEWIPLGEKSIAPTVGRLEVVRLVQPGKKSLVSPLPVHNKYMLTLSELGLVGLILWVCIYIHLFKEAWACSKSKDALLRYVGVGGLAAIIASLSYMMLDLFASDKSVQILFFVPLLVTAAARIARESKEIS